LNPGPQPPPFAAKAEAVENEKAGPVIVAGSTLEGEEVVLLSAFRHVQSEYPDAVLFLSPRHPERFDDVAALLRSSGTSFGRRSQWSGNGRLAGTVFLLDTIGELAAFYEFADIAFVGGSLVPRGGHNVIEAAQFGVPILVGPHTENFRDIIQIFRDAVALRVVTIDNFTATVLDLLEKDDERSALGQRALQVMQSQQGATDRTVDALLSLLQTNAPLREKHSESRA
jgi:3-deoxy-D-manno-octulosonic-acid transferase